MTLWIENRVARALLPAQVFTSPDTSRSEREET